MRLNIARPIVSALFIFILICGYVLAFLPQPVHAVDGWYDSGYGYRKQITVTGPTAGAQTNYQFALTLLYSGNDLPALNVEPAYGTYAADAGTGATTIVDAALTSTVDGYYVGCYISNITRGLTGIVTAYVGSTKTITCASIAGQVVTDAYFVTPRAATIGVDSKTQADFDDIRFTKSDGITPLDYWLECKTNSSTATVWVEVGIIPASPSTATFYIYYGNSSAIYAGNGANTFIIFDDFERGSNGDNVGGIWTAAAGTVLISTDHNYTALSSSGVAGTRSAKILGSAGATAMAVTKTFGSNFAINERIWKEDLAICRFPHIGNGTYISHFGSDINENIVYTNNASASVDTLYNMVANQWQYIGARKFNFTSLGTYILEVNNYWYEVPQMFPVAGFISTISTADLISGVGNDEYVDNFMVRNFCAPEPLITAIAVVEGVATPLVIQDVKVFTGYKEVNDWLITVRYIDIYAPYYDTYDVKKYFTLQLVDATATVKASSPVPAWGNRVGNIYLSAATVSPLTYGGDYSVRVYGTFTGNTYVEYAIQATDWMGDDLVNLDSWVITSSSVIGTYYSTTMTTYIAERGEVLNSTGAGIFSAGIAGLSTVRPAIFQTYTIPSSYTPGTIRKSVV